MVLLPRIARTAGVAGAIVTVAFLLFAVVFAATGDAPAAMVFRPPAATALPDGVKIFSWGRAFIVVTSDEPDYVRKLYGTGALLVLPVRKSGCLVYRSSLPI
jgi:hypothetical protein